jgi:hypothetical protein
MSENRFDELRADFDAWRARLDHARVQANLGRKELADKVRDLDQRFDPAYRRAKERLAALAQSGADEARALAQSLQAGWEELKTTHRDLARRAREERDRPPS